MQMFWHELEMIWAETTSFFLRPRIFSVPGKSILEWISWRYLGGHGAAAAAQMADGKV